MTDIIPTIGRIVWYALSIHDVEQIRERRLAAGVWAFGNVVEVGKIYPAQIVAVWGDKPDSYVNLKVALDGPDTYWATSRHVGEGPGTYQWMPYQKGQAAKTEAAEAAKLAPLPQTPPPTNKPVPSRVYQMRDIVKFAALLNGFHTADTAMSVTSGSARLKFLDCGGSPVTVTISA